LFGEFHECGPGRSVIGCKAGRENDASTNLPASIHPLKERMMNKAVGDLSKGVLEKVNGWTFEDGAVVELRSSSVAMTVCASLRGRDGREYVQVTYWCGANECQVYDLLPVGEVQRKVTG
jgi:hypothetical protein